MAEEMVSVWVPEVAPLSTWMTPPLDRSRLPPLSVYLKAVLLPVKVMPPMLRFASTVTIRSAVRVKPKVATSVLVVPEVAPGAAVTQLPGVTQLPAASAFHESLAARTGKGARAKVHAATSASAVRDLLDI